jgi:hypothetical protein
MWHKATLTQRCVHLVRAERIVVCDCHPSPAHGQRYEQVFREIDVVIVLCVMLFSPRPTNSLDRSSLPFIRTRTLVVRSRIHALMFVCWAHKHADITHHAPRFKCQDLSLFSQTIAANDD